MYILLLTLIAVKPAYTESRPRKPCFRQAFILEVRLSIIVHVLHIFRGG